MFTLSYRAERRRVFAEECRAIAALAHLLRRCEFIIRECHYTKLAEAEDFGMLAYAR
jgi:hypothetical protein